MRDINRSQLLAITLTITLFGVFLVAQLTQHELLFGYQPYVQQFFADYGEADRLLNQRVQIHSGEFVLPHHSLLRTTSYVVAEGGGLDSTLLFRFGPIGLRLVYTLLVMMIVVAMTRKVQTALVVGIALFTSPFFVFQSPLLIPSTVSILFLLLMVWSLEQYRQSGRVVFMLVMMLSLLGHAFYDPTSILMSLIIVGSYLVQFLFNEEPRKIEVTTLSLLAALLLLLPMFGTLIEIVATSFGRFGDNSSWTLYEGNRALEPVVNRFFELAGYPISIFGILGVVAIIRWYWKQYLHLLIMLVCVLVLMLNFTPRLQFDLGRMQAFLYMVLVLISGVYISLLFSRMGRIVRMMMVSTLIIFGIATMLTTPPWQRLDDDQLAIVAMANDFLAENPDAIIYVEADAMALAVVLDHPEQICAYWEPVFQWYVPPADGDPPDCRVATYRMAAVGRNLPEYRIADQTETLSLYVRVVDATVEG